MTWDPYGMPHAPSDPDTEYDPRYNSRRLPEAEPPKIRTVLAVFAAMVLLAVVFSVAAQAQNSSDTTKQQQSEATAEQQSQSGDAQESQAASGQQQEQKESESATTMKAPDEQAGSAEAQAAPLDGQIIEQPENSYLASDMIGRGVVTAEGEEMGQISDLLMTEDDEMAGVLIGVGGFLGFGEKLIAVNIHQLSRTTTEDGTEQLALNYTRTQLEEAPAFVSLAEQQRRAEAEQARMEQEQQQQQMQQQQSGSGTGQQSGQTQSY